MEEVTPAPTCNGAPARRRLRAARLHRPQELAAFQEEFTQVNGGIHIEPLRGHALDMQGTVTCFDGTLVGFGATSPTRCIHPRADGAEGVMLVGLPRGRGLLQADGREWAFGDGDMVFTRAGQPVTTVVPGRAAICEVLLHRPLLEAMRIDVDAALLRPVRRHAAAALLAQYAHLLCEHDALAVPELRRAAVLHLHDLAALLAGAGGEAAHLARERGGQAARRLAVQRDIAAHLTEPGLSADAVARRQGVTPRYLHRLLAQEGEHFSALVLEQRLALAHRLLADPRLAARAISAIAFEAGFGDLSYFNRSFRRRFGMTPTDVRAQASAWASGSVASSS